MVGKLSEFKHKKIPKYMPYVLVLLGIYKIISKENPEIVWEKTPKIHFINSLITYL